MKDSDDRFYLGVWILAFIVVGFFLYLIQLWDEHHPAKSTYEYVQDYREEHDFYVNNGEDFVYDWYGEETTEFTKKDIEDAYNAGLEDGIEQTIEYYESLDD